MSNARIVIIENNPRRRAAVKSLLAPIHADFFELSNGNDCCDFLTEILPDVIIAGIDDSLRKSGVSSLLGIDSASGKPPIILIGTGIPEDDMMAAVDGGVHAAIENTEIEEKLLATVAAILEKSDKHPAGAKILVVDDSNAVRLFLAKGLTGEGYRVQTAEDGKIALEMLTHCRPDLILSDVYMPKMNGLELREALYEDPRYSGIPFVVMSTENDAANMRKMMQLGAAAFIIKPFNLEQLMMTLNKIFSYEFLLLHKENERLDGERKLLLAAITSLVRALEARDQYTRGHSERVSQILSDLVRYAGATSRETERARIAGRLHDIGKIGISDNILLKPGRLSAEEFAHIQEHPFIGSSIIGNIPSIADILPVVIAHHERFDGHGYPQGLQGSAIPLWARMTAVADTYDALTSDRPYRKGMAHDKAMAIITNASGSQLCPDTVRLFLDYCQERGVAGVGLPR